MARSLHRLLLLLLAACLLLHLQISDCSSSPALTEESRKPGDTHGDALRHQLQLDAENRTVLPTTTAAADDGRTSDDGAASSAATPPPALDKDGVGSGPPKTSERAGFKAAVLLRSKRRARRFLDAVDDAGTDGAGLSCHSNSVHVNCPPGSKP